MYQKLSSGFLKKEFIPYLFFALVDAFIFWKFFFKGQIPIPADVILGGYFPWLNEKWGYAVGVPIKNSLMSDVPSLLYPWRLSAIETIKSGQLPLWDPSTFLGMTLIGNFQAGIFNPFDLLFLIPVDFNYIWGLQVVIQPFLAMSFMYLMLRNWQLSKPSSIFGSIAFAFSAQLLVWVEYNLHGFAISVFPLYILILDKILKTGKLYFFALLSLMTAYIIFAGYPLHLYYFLLFGFVYLS